MEDEDNTAEKAAAATRPGTASGLSRADAELLVMLAEEASEIVQAATKMLRHGPFSFNPDLPSHKRETNMAQLRRELRDLAALCFLWDATPYGFKSLEVDPSVVVLKLKYTHFQQERSK